MTVHTPFPPVAGPPDGLSGPPARDVPTAGPGAGRRVAEWAGLAVVWIAVGWSLGVDVAEFLVVGIPLAVAFQLVVRRRPLRQLWARDGTTFARGRSGKCAVAAVLLMVVAAAVAQSAGSWIDDSRTVLLLVAIMLLTYALGRRLFVALSVAALVVVAATGVLAPRLAAARTGDSYLLAQLADQQNMGLLAGLHDLAVAEVDLGDGEPVRSASVGDLTSSTPVEIGSVTKALTGLVIADSVQRGELRLDAPVSTCIPQLQGSPAGAVTMQELVTHTAGYADFGSATLRRAFLHAPVEAAG
jgi:beta-lactamase family protein